MHARLLPKKLIGSLIKPDFPSLTDEIAEPRPDMNIKVTAFTVSEKSINTCTAGLPTFRFIEGTFVRRCFCHHNVWSKSRKPIFGVSA